LFLKFNFKKRYSMNKKFTRYSKFYTLALLGGLSLGAQAQVTTQTFSYTGGMQTFTVPSCVTSITVDAAGAAGTDYVSGSLVRTGGLGGRVVCVYPVTTGQVLNIFVGGRPYNGGGPAYVSNGGIGGGASDIRIGGTALSDRVIVAGGGGGGGHNCTGSGTERGGHGGGLVAEDGWQCGAQTMYIGTGASQTGPGLCLSTQNPGTNGALGVGGNAGNSSYGGGGGGGYYGGGGSSYGGAGGGSSYTGPLASAVSHSQGVRAGNGEIVLIYDFNGTAVAASATSMSICTGGTTTLSASGMLSCTWTPGGSNASSIAVSPGSTTSYTVEGTNSFGCISRSVLTVTVNNTVPSLTVANTAGNSAGICPNSTVNLLASGALSYTWTGGNQPVSNGVTFSPNIAAQYTVSGSNGCGISTAVTSVSVHPLPVVNPVPSSNTVCAGSQLTLTAQGNAATYTWTGGSVSFTNGIGFVPNTSTVYTLSGTSALNCTAMATLPVTVYVTPTLVPIASPVVVCIGGSSTLSASGALNYTWTSATQTVNTSMMIVTPTSSGITTYTVVKSNSNCSDTKTINVITNDLPTVAAIAMPQTVCALSPATLAAGGALNYTWTAPGTPNYTFTGASNVISTPVPATYTVAASDGTCINTATVHLATNPVPTVVVSANSTSICSGQPVNLSASGASNYTWTTGTNTFYTASITDNPTVPTAYQVVGDNSFGCTAQVSQVILVYNSPTMTAGPDKNLICNGTAVTFTASGTTSYSWDTGSAPLSGSVISVNPVSSVSGPVIYTVTGVDNIGCQSTRTTQVNVYVPVLSISGSTNACAGGTLQLTASGGNSNSYAWQTGGAPIPGASLNTSLTAAGILTVTANSTSLAITCPVSQTVAVDLHPNPVITAAAERTTICSRESVELYASGGNSYQWNNGASHATITVSPQIQTTYTVTGTDANGCQNTGTVQVRVSACVGIAEASLNAGELLVYPNPNNGTFTIRVSADIKLVLVNELGQFVRSMDLSAGTDHEASVRDLPEGIYFLSGQNDSVRVNQKIIVAK
jgi:hypothetical protein